MSQVHSGVDKNTFKVELLRCIDGDLGKDYSREWPMNASVPTGSSSEIPSLQTAQPAAVTPPITSSRSSPSQSQTPRLQTDAAPSLPRPPYTQSDTVPSQQALATPPSNIQSLLSDRRNRLETSRKAAEEAEKSQRIEKGKARAQETANPESAPSTRRDQVSYAQQQVQRKREAQQERYRVLQRIENDKRERKEKEERRRELARAEALDAGEEAPKAGNLLTSSPPPPMGGKCTIRVVLLDGSTLRSSFFPEETIRKIVRPFIDTERTDGDVPYTFKHLLTPSPSRSLAPSDEDKTLQSLGLVPSATLILVPIQGFTITYRRDAGGAVRKFSSMLYAYLLAFFLTIWRYARVFSGIGPRQQRVTPSNRNAGGATPARQLRAPPSEEEKSGSSTSVANGAAPPGPSIRIRTLRDRRERDQRDGADEQQFYNGNQVYFSSRCWKMEDEWMC